MKRWWPREVLRFVDAWACREGTPEDDEDAQKTQGQDSSDSEPVTVGILQADARGCSTVQSSSVSKEPRASRADLADQRIWGINEGTNNEWIELQEHGDEELGHEEAR
jgi:hypothetical protein